MSEVEPNKISILCTDDHPMMRLTWEFLFKSDERFNMVGVCASGEEAIELAKNLQPDIVFMDINLKGINGLEATQLITKISPNTRIIGVSQHSQPWYANQMIEAGAMGYLTKTSSKDEMFKAIMEVFSGNKYICEEIREGLTEDPDDTNKKGPE